MKISRGWLAIIVLTLLPCFYLLSLSPLSSRFGDFTTTMYSLGKLTGLAGMVLFALSFLLSTRISFVEDAFDGLDKMYWAHHMIGTLSFVLLLFHPLFLASRIMVNSASDAIKFLLPGNNLAINFGIIGLMLMMLFLIFTFFIKLQYQKWRFTHQFLGLAFIIASIHVLMIPSDTSRNMLLRLYMIIMMLIGVASYSYRTLFWRIFVKRHEFIVDDVKELNESIFEITLASKTNKINFVPGQFIFADFNGEPHPFTISSPPSDNLKITIKKLGDFTNQIQNIKKGTKVLIEGPYGKFCPTKYPKDQIWIAGGIGITPFLSAARAGMHTKVDLYYCVRTPEEALFLKELEQIPNINVIQHCSKEHGRIYSEYILKKSGYGQEIFMCGPVEMMNSLKTQFKKAGIPSTKIHAEEFELL